MLQRIEPQTQNGAGTMVQVSEEARRRITEALEKSLAPTTRINYMSQWRKWETFAGERGYPVFAADPVHLADWITQRADYGQKPGTIRMGLAAVGSVHRQANLPNPAEDEGVRATMRGITRIAGRAQKQAVGLTVASLAAIRATACVPRTGRGGSLETAETAEARGHVDIALISLMRDGMLRRSEAESAVLFVSALTMEALRAIRPSDASAGDSLFGLSDDQIARRDRTAGTDDCGEVAVAADAREIYPRGAGRTWSDCAIL